MAALRSRKAGEKACERGGSGFGDQLKVPHALEEKEGERKRLLHRRKLVDGS